MWNWVWMLAYYVGAAVTLRRYVLYLAARRESKKLSGRCWYREPEAGWAVPATAFWPVLALCYFTWKALFPRGVRTKKMREREREAKLQLIEDQKAAQRAREKELFEQASAILREFVIEQDAIEAAVPEALRHWNPNSSDDKVLDYSVAERCFADACEQVWRERGKPWHIGALTAVKTRTRVAKRS